MVLAALKDYSKVKGVLRPLNMGFKILKTIVFGKLCQRLKKLLLLYFMFLGIFKRFIFFINFSGYGRESKIP